MKKTEKIMEFLAAQDFTHDFRDAGTLVGCEHHTVARYVRARDAGRLTAAGPERRDQLVDGFREKIEEWVEARHSRIRADVAQHLARLRRRRGGRRCSGELRVRVRLPGCGTPLIATIESVMPGAEAGRPVPRP